MSQQSSPSEQALHGVPRRRLSSFYFNYYAVIGILVPYLSLYLSDLGLNAKQIGLLVAVPTISKIIAPNILSWLAVKYGHPAFVIRISTLLACVALLGFYVGVTFTAVFVTLLVFSFFFNASMPLFEALTLEHLKEDSHGYSSIRIWGSVGFIFSVMVVGWAFDNWPVSYFREYILFFAFAVFISALLAHAPSSLRVKVSEHGLWEAVRQPFVICFFISMFLLQLSHGMYYAFYSLFLEKNGYSGSMMGVLWSVGVVAEILLFLKVRPIFKRFDLRQCLIFCFMCAAIRWVLIVEFPALVAVQFVVQALHAFTFGLVHVSAMEFIRQRFVGPKQAQGQSLYTAFCWGGGTGSGALLAGFAWGLGPAYVFYGASLFALFALFVILFFSSSKQLQASSAG